LRKDLRIVERITYKALPERIFSQFGLGRRIIVALITVG